MDRMDMDASVTKDTDCQRIGSLALTIGSSLRVSDSIPNGQPTSSAITGYRSLTAQDREKKTGRQLSAIAAASLPAVVAAMGNADAEATDKALVASLPPSLRCALRERTETLIDPNYGYDYAIVGYALGKHMPGDDLAVGREMVAASLAPAAASVIKAELARLRASTKSRAEDDIDVAMGFQVRAEECAKYPADVVRDALRRLGRSETFYPSLSALLEALQRSARRRVSLRDALARAPESEDWPDWLAKIWGPMPDGPRKRTAALNRGDAPDEREAAE